MGICNNKREMTDKRNEKEKKGNWREKIDRRREGEKINWRMRQKERKIMTKRKKKQ